MQVIERAKKRFAEEQIRSFLEAMKKLGYQWEEILALLKEKEEENGDS
jgi:DNA-binding transcriptional regulator YhcF (GntR family)